MSIQGCYTLEKNRKRRHDVINICPPIIQIQTYKSELSREKQVN